MRRSRRKGFTLIEVLLASLIGAFVAVVAVSTLKAVTVTSRKLEDHMSAASNVRYSALQLKEDLSNIYRDRKFANCRFAALPGDEESGGSVRLIFYTISNVKARAMQPEGDVYEVEYFLTKDDEGKGLLMRRLWPNPEKEVEPGGILTVLADDIDYFGVQFFDGSDWQAEWPEEIGKFPSLVEVTLAAKASGTENMVLESFMVNYARDTGEEPDDSDSQDDMAQGDSEEGG